MKKSSPLLNKLFILSCLLFGVGSTVYAMGSYDYFSPWHTNSMNLFISLLCHMGVVMGPAAVYGMQSIGYSIYPKRFDKIMANNVMGFGRSQGALSRVLQHMGVLSVVPITLMYVSMQLMDELNMLSLAPGVIWTGIATTAIYYKSRELKAPLWITRQFYLFGIFAIMT